MGGGTWSQSLTEGVVDLTVAVRRGGVGRPVPVEAIDHELAPRAAARRDQEHEEEREQSGDTSDPRRHGHGLAHRTTDHQNLIPQ